MNYSTAHPAPEEADEIRRRLGGGIDPNIVQPTIVPDRLYSSDAAHNAATVAALTAQHLRNLRDQRDQRDQRDLRDQRHHNHPLGPPVTMTEIPPGTSLESAPLLTSPPPYSGGKWHKKRK